MTDDKATPAGLDTEAIMWRAKSAAEYGNQGFFVDSLMTVAEHAVPALLAALAAERDRADRAEARLADAGEKWRFEHALYQDAILQRDAARERVLNAPHDDLCAVWDISGGESSRGCTCWKSEATA
jgi:hypothetical protein